MIGMFFGGAFQASEYRRISPQQTLVLFGATGDLAKRGIIPGLVQLAKRKQLPEAFKCIGLGLEDENGAGYRAHLGSLLPEGEQGIWHELKERFSLIPGDFKEEQVFQELFRQLQGCPGEKTFYLAVPPDCFSLVIEKLHAHDLLDDACRVVIEKPFGLDLQSAQKLQGVLTRCLNEDQIYRNDHFLGAGVARQILELRRSLYPAIEDLWNQNWIDHVAITIEEDMGVGTRGRFWEQTGYLCDVVQNHIMQLLTLVAVDLPGEDSSESLQEKKCQVLQNLRPVPLNDVDSFIVRGQYAAGVIGGEAVKGYREEAYVPQDSHVETAIIGKLFIDNERWRGVPFLIKGGKRVARTRFQVEVVFKPFGSTHDLARIVFQLLPQEEVALYAHYPQDKVAGNVNPIESFLPTSELGTSSMPASYAFLLNEVMQGRRDHFVSYEEIFLSWKFFQPIIEYWKECPREGLVAYPSGSNGPALPVFLDNAE